MHELLVLACSVTDENVVALRHPGWEDPRDFRSLAARRPQGGRAADDGSGEGGVIDAIREYVTPNIIMDTWGGDPSTGGGLFAAPRAGDVVSFAPLLPPRMPPKDEQ